MNDEERNSESTKSSSGLLDTITGKISKLKALLLVLGGLLVTLVFFLGEVERFLKISSDVLAIFKSEESATSLQDCFQAKINYPEMVSVSGWQSMYLSLTGRNDCREKLNIHVAFKTKQFDKVRIKSPFSDCLDLDNPRCWEERSIKTTEELDEKFTPPDLEVLKKPLGDPVHINVNWLVYNAETKMQLAAGTAHIQLTDDP